MGCKGVFVTRTCFRDVERVHFGHPLVLSSFTTTYSNIFQQLLISIVAALFSHEPFYLLEFFRLFTYMYVFGLLLCNNTPETLIMFEHYVSLNERDIFD